MDKDKIKKGLAPMNSQEPSENKLIKQIGSLIKANRYLSAELNGIREQYAKDLDQLRFDMDTNVATEKSKTKALKIKIQKEIDKMEEALTFEKNINTKLMIELKRPFWSKWFN